MKLLRGPLNGQLVLKQTERIEPSTSGSQRSRLTLWNTTSLQFQPRHLVLIVSQHNGEERETPAVNNAPPMGKTTIMTIRILHSPDDYGDCSGGGCCGGSRKLHQVACASEMDSIVVEGGC